MFLHVQNFHADFDRSFASKHEWICKSYGFYTHKYTAIRH